MIPGHEAIPVKEFMFIDRMSEGLGFTRPKDGESFVGIPAGYYSTEGTRPFIEVWQGEVLLRTINCDDISEIVFVGAD